MPLSPSATKKTRGAVVGRRVALMVYWALTLWLCIAALISIVPQVFWPSEARGEAPATVASCDEALRELDAELLTGASDRIATLADSDRTTEDFLVDWDTRYRALHVPCGERRAYSALNRLRHALGTELGRALEAAPLAREVRVALDEDERSP